MANLLITKLQIPQLRTRTILRPRLADCLEQGLAKKLTLISAPAGYGKTTLLAAWLAAAQQPAAWVSLDKGDNDPARFWAYIIAALQRVDASLGKSLPELAVNSDLPPHDSLITGLINELDALPQSLVLVLDDYHNIETQAVHDALSYLIEYAPANFHLILSTRADPPLPLARLRSRSNMLELRQADLCFTAQEASDFLTHSMGLQISSEDAARITTRTEGWIAGLQMAAISMQNTQDISGFITSLTGAHHYIFDYLLEEILEQQTPEIRRFLLYTSILDQLTAPLCDAILQADAQLPPARSSAVLLEELERGNLFIFPLDQERRWYRYHTLFADLLRGYLQRNQAGEIPALHLRASIWFEEQALIPDAIHHALAAGEWERVIRLISANVFALLEQDELNAVARRLDSLSSAESSARPWLWIGRAWLAAYTGKLNEVESILILAEEEMASADRSTSGQTFHGHCAAIRAFTAWMSGKQEIAAQSAQEALKCLSPAETMIRCQSATILGLSYNDIDARARAFDQAMAYAQESSVSHITFFAHGCRAFMLVMQGRLHEAFAACHDALRLAQSSRSHQPLLTLSYVYSTLSMILLEWNDIEGAIRNAREAVSLAKRWEQADALHFAYTNLGNVLIAAGEVPEAFLVLQQAWQIAHRTSPWFEEITVSQEVDWNLALGNTDAALQRLRVARVDLEETSRTDLSQLMSEIIGPVFFAKQQYPRALSVVNSVLVEMEKRKTVYYSIRTLVWQALIHHVLGQEAQALASLRRALGQAAPEGYIRSFCVGNGAIGPLLRQLRTEGVQPEYVDRLLASLAPAEKTHPPAAKTDSPLLEPLSEREVDVLKLLAQGASDKEIAASLVIACGTVHKHLNNIYSKLGVHSRVSAIVRARDLGVL